MNKKRILAAALAAAVIAPQAARAAGLESVRAQAEAAFPAALGAALADLQPKDLFADLTECRIVDAKPILPFTLEQTLGMIGPCMRAISARYGNKVSALAGYVGAPRGQDAPQGILIGVEAGITAKHVVLRDLQYSMSLREGRILGHPARVIRQSPLFRIQPEPDFRTQPVGPVFRILPYPGPAVD